jgi:hypothetical protein
VRSGRAAPQFGRDSGDQVVEQDGVPLADFVYGAKISILIKTQQHFFESVTLNRFGQLISRVFIF